MKTKLTLSIAAALVSLSFICLFAGQDNPGDTSDDLRQVLGMFRSDINSTKIRTFNQVLKLTPAEAERFWPVYKEYEKELAALAERKLALLREFFKHHQAASLNNINSSDLAEKWLALVEGRLALWRKYHGRIAQEVSAVRAAQFLQVEHQISLLIDINIAAEVPFISVPAKTP